MQKEIKSLKSLSKKELSIHMKKIKKFIRLKLIYFHFIKINYIKSTKSLEIKSFLI